MGHRGHSWPRLLARLADELGLPEITYRPGRRGRPETALGTKAAVIALCRLAGVEFDPALWTFSADPQKKEATMPAAAPMPMPKIRPEHATIQRLTLGPNLPPLVSVMACMPVEMPTYLPPPSPVVAVACVA